MTKDPYMIDPKAAKEYSEKNKGSGTGGVFCPKRNVSLDGECRVCKALQPLWSYPENSKERNKAADKGPKQTFYMNIVLPKDPTKWITLEVGNKAGNAVLDGIIDDEKGWYDIAHPKKGVGREMKIKKKNDGGHNFYDVFPAKDKADYDISDEVLQDMPDLDNIIELLKSGVFDETNFMRITKAINVDETMTFRICPPKDPTKEGAVPLVAVWRHWAGVTQDEVDGKVRVNLWDESEAPDDQLFEKQTSSEDTPEKAPEEDVPTESKNPGCFGQSYIFDADDDDCKKCPVFKSCAKKVLA